MCRYVYTARVVTFALLTPLRTELRVFNLVPGKKSRREEETSWDFPEGVLRPVCPKTS